DPPLPRVAIRLTPSSGGRSNPSRPSAGSRSPVYARRMFDPSDVADAREVGIDPHRLSELLDRARRDVDSHLLPSCQLAAARHGRLAAFHTFGEATNETRYVIFSCTKALVAAA